MHQRFVVLPQAQDSPEQPGLRTIMVGTYPPMRCGLATFTANSRRGLLAANPRRSVAVLRLGPPPDDDHRRTAGGYETMPEVWTCWPRGSDPADAADACAPFDVVLAQHEFGIYDGRDGDAVVEFANHLEPPLVSVLHTVLVDPSQRQRAIIEALAARSERIVVMSEAAADRLIERYRVDVTRVHAIPHGADVRVNEPDDGPPEPAANVPTRLPIVLTWGLIGPGKGIEHGIKALAVLAGRGLPVRYVIAGQTHPNVLRAEGERYRQSLRRLADELGVGDCVVFDDRYRSWDEVYAQARHADVVLLPYDSREQVTSGVLVEALASARPIVATAFPHALEVVARRSGIVVAHEEPEAMANAIERLLAKPDLRRRYAEGARREGLRHAWPTVGAQYDAVLQAAVRARV